jgi:hypothetical protein
VSRGDDCGRELVAELIAQLEELLARATDVEADPLEVVEVDPLLLRGAPGSPPATPWQRYANELRDLCQHVLDEADEETAVAFWLFLIEMAAHHGRRGGWPA